MNPEEIRKWWNERRKKTGQVPEPSKDKALTQDEKIVELIKQLQATPYKQEFVEGQVIAISEDGSITLKAGPQPKSTNQVRQRIIDELIRIGDPAVPYLSKIIFKDGRVDSGILEILSKIKSKLVLAQFASLLESNEEDTKLIGFMYFKELTGGLPVIEFHDKMEGSAEEQDAKVFKIIKNWWDNNKDYFYWSDAENHFVIDEKAKAIGIPTEEYRKTHPWPKEPDKPDKSSQPKEDTPK